MNRFAMQGGAAFFAVSIMVVLLSLLLLVGACAATSHAPPATAASGSDVKSIPALSEADLAATKAKLNATFRNFQFDDIRPSEIPGILEIYAGAQVIYYAPKQDVLILGEFYASDGSSLTQQKLSQRAAHQASAIDKSAALVVGDGPTEVLEFVDPDCPHCRAANEWLTQQNLQGIRELVFFMPTNGRASATARAIRALCAAPENRRAALHDAFDRASDAQPMAEASCAEGAARLTRQGEIGRQLGVNATPFFIVNGQVVAGFDRERLSALLLKPQTQTEGEKR